MELAILIVILGLVFDYTNGFHDAANVVSTVIATRVLAPLSAVVMAGALNFIGATQISGVAETIATGLVQTEQTPQLVVLCSIIGAIFWNLLTWYFGIPSSSSYALIGGLLGASWAHRDLDAIIWRNVLDKVLIPMVVSPLIGFLFGLCIMQFINWIFRGSAAREKRVFRHLQIGSACFVALSHGLNDAQKSMGLITLGLFAGGYLTTTEIPVWVIMSCAIVMGLGTGTGGFRIIRTMGFSITRLDTAQGFAAEASASIVILAASFSACPSAQRMSLQGGLQGSERQKAPSLSNGEFPNGSSSPGS